MEMSVTSKAEIRKAIRKQRTLLSESQKNVWDEMILEQLKAGGFFRGEATVYCYASVRGEAGTEQIIQWLRSLGIRVALPRVCGKTMAFYYCDSPEDAAPGFFGIPEPEEHCIPAQEKNAPVIVPGVAFSENMDRIGYGAGYYDRFFASEPLHPKIAIAYDFQRIKKFDAALEDQPMDCLVTPTGVFHASGRTAAGDKIVRNG